LKVVTAAAGATARLYSGAPSALTNVSQLFASPLVDRTSLSIGVEGGANSQLDTNIASRREALLVTSNKALKLSGIDLSWVDNNDTLKIYGINPDGTLTTLAEGLIGSGLGGLATAVLPNGFGNTNANTAALTLFASLPAYDRFLLTTQLGGQNGANGQGYRLASLTGAVVPEPATWAMLIAGFGLVGAAARRLRSLPA
jgi:hypothetical protein